MGKISLHQKATVLENRCICSNYYHLILRNETIAKTANPGQFVDLLINDRNELLFRRPFSVAITKPDQCLFEIVYQVIGKGTAAMTSLRTDDVVDLLGPLGVGFHLPAKATNCLLLGGGCGVAALWGMAEHLYREKHSIIALLGFQSSTKVFGEVFFGTCNAEVTVTTNDGSCGLKGFVSDHLERVIQGRKIDSAYVCGPVPMLKAVIPILKEKNIRGEVALEEKMGCGYGVCLSCAVPVIKDGIIERQRVCVEGPVFKLEEIVIDDRT